MKIKYPRTPHLDFSLSKSSDDKVLKDISCFENKNVIVSIKMDGENSSLYRDNIHARSLDSNNHISRNWVKGLWGEINYLIPKNFRICGENLYAKHSIKYDDLKSYFYVFNIWDYKTCLSYNETIEYCELLRLIHVPVLYNGIFNYEIIKEIFNNLDKEKHEGIVIRNSDSFNYGDFKFNVAKAVRNNHVNTDEHWMNNKIIPNKLK